jgi:Fe-Mn family superoxide dismutase
MVAAGVYSRPAHTGTRSMMERRSWCAPSLVDQTQKSIRMTNTHYPFELPPLPYAADALEPHFDARTMRIHHDEHHRTYVERLNAALKDHPSLHAMTVEELLRDPGRIPDAARTAVRNNGGGHLNHSLLWSLIEPHRQSGPKGRLLEAMKASFGTVETFRKRFSEVATGHFASGWAFLVADSKSHALEVVALPDHQCVLGSHETVLLVCDVWEHAYYLKHQNRRPEYLDCWWAVANWQAAERRFNLPR